MTIEPTTPAPQLLGHHVLLRRGATEAFLGCVREVAPASSPAPLAHLVLEGKAVWRDARGELAVAPFATRLTVAFGTGALEELCTPEAAEEAELALARPIAELARASFPLLRRWISAALSAGGHVAADDPYAQAVAAFGATADRLRRALMLSPQVTSSRELERLGELEGNLVIELGQVTSDVALRLGALAGQEPELVRWLERLGTDQGLPGNAGWGFLTDRLLAVKEWSRQRGRTALVREANGLLREVITRANDALLEHSSALDTLVTEAFSQYGIPHEPWGELTPCPPVTPPVGALAATARPADGRPAVV